MKKIFLTLAIVFYAVTGMAKEYCEVKAETHNAKKYYYEIVYGTDDPRNEEGEVTYLIEIINMMQAKGYDFVNMYNAYRGKMFLFVKEN